MGTSLEAEILVVLRLALGDHQFGVSGWVLTYQLHTPRNPIQGPGNR